MSVVFQIPGSLVLISQKFRYMFILAYMREGVFCRIHLTQALIVPESTSSALFLNSFIFMILFIYVLMWGHTSQCSGDVPNFVVSSDALGCSGTYMLD